MSQRVWVVDDEPLIRTAMLAVLSEVGYEARGFGDAEELYTALLEWGVSRLAETLHAAIPSPEEGADGRESLTRVLRAGVVFIGEHEELARMLMAEAWRTNRAWYATVHQLRNEAIGVLERQWAQRHVVGNAEHRAVNPTAEGEAQNRQRRKARAAEQPSGGVPNVLGERVHGR